MSQQAQAMVQAQQKTSEVAPSRNSVFQHAAVISPLTAVQHGILQRCSGGVECAECRQQRLEREGMMQRTAVNSASVNAVPPIVHDVLSSSGQSLDAGTRAFMEPRFGHDFSLVRVHTDERAAESARAVNSLAYTVGRDVVFAAGLYAPGTSEGRRLLAHELTHVVQQGIHDSSSMQSKLAIGQPGDAFEREADHTAEVVGDDNALTIGQSTAHTMQMSTVTADDQLAIGRPQILYRTAPRIQRRVRFFACNDAERRNVEGVVGFSIPVADLRSAADTVSARLASWTSTAAAALRVSPRSAATRTSFHQAFGANPEWVPPWKPPGASWVDFGDLIMTRLSRAAGIIDDGSIQFFCWGSPAHCPECRRPPGTYFACSSFLGSYRICLGQDFWNAWRRGDATAMSLTLLHEPLHIYFGRTVADSGRSGNAFCYERFVLSINGLPMDPVTAALCPAAP